MSRIRLLISPFLIVALVAALSAQEKKDSKEKPKEAAKKDAKGTPPKEAVKKDDKAKPKEPPKKDDKAKPKEPPKKEDKPKDKGNDKDKTHFTLKLEKGKAFHQKMTTAVTQIIKVQGQDLTQKQDSTFFFKWTPDKQDGDKWSIKEKIEGLKMSIDISGNPITYDSTKPDQPGSAGNPGLMDFFKNLQGAEFSVTLNTKSWKVEKVDGKADFVKKLGAGNMQMDSLLKKIMTDDAIKQMADPTFGFLPDSAKAPKDTWEKKQTLGLGPIGSYEVTYKFTYVGKDATQKNLDRIDVATTLTYKPPTGGTEGLLFKIKDGKMESKPLDAGQQSSILYNPATGRIEKATIYLKLRGELNVTIGGTDTKVELDQSQVTTIESKNEPFLAPETLPKK